MGDALTLVRIGTETDGDPAMVCPHLAQWWPVWLDRLAVEGIPAPPIVQARGSYAGRMILSRIKIIVVVRC